MEREGAVGAARPGAEVEESEGTHGGVRGEMGDCVQRIHGEARGGGGGGGSAAAAAEHVGGEHRKKKTTPNLIMGRQWSENNKTILSKRTEDAATADEGADDGVDVRNSCRDG